MPPKELRARLDKDAADRCAAWLRWSCGGAAAGAAGAAAAAAAVVAASQSGCTGAPQLLAMFLRAVLLTVGLAAAPAAAPRSVILERALKRLEWERVQEKVAKEKVGERVAAGL